MPTVHMMIRPTGEDTTMTRKALLAAREKETARLREKWKTDKEKEVTGDE